MDSLARNSLLEIREKQTLNTEPWKGWNENPKIISATEWLANVMMNPAVADDWPVFRVDNPDLISLLKLPDKDAAKQIRRQALFLEPDPAVAGNVRTRKTSAFKTSRPPAAPPTKTPSPKCSSGSTLYAQLKNAVQPADAQDWPAELAAFEKLIPAGVAAAQAQQAGKKFDKTNFNTFVAFIAALSVHGQPGAAADSAAERRDANGGAWATRCSTRRAERRAD